MALNWLMLDSNGDMEPLQGEKIFLTVPSVQMTLRPRSLAQHVTGSTPVNAQLRATGRVHLTNQRLCFVSDAAATQSQTQDQQLPQYELHTLSCPLTNFQEGRFMQPWLAANYYEAIVVPVSNGGFTEPQLAKLTFNQGRGFEFSQVFEEVSRRFMEESGGDPSQSGDAEVLPAYDPRPQASTSSASVMTSNSAQPGDPVPPPRMTASPAPQEQSRPRTPDREDMEVAQVARNAEATEWRERQNSIQEGPDGPPAYVP